MIIGLDYIIIYTKKLCEYERRIWRKKSNACQACVEILGRAPLAKVSELTRCQTWSNPLANSLALLTNG